MSFTISVKLDKVSSYGEIGVIVSSGTDSVDVTYEAISLSYFDGSTGIAVFKTSVSGATTFGNLSFKFTYEGTGNPLTVAESALQTYLS